MKRTLRLLAISMLLVQSLSAQLALKYKTYSENYYKGLRYGLFKPVNYQAGKAYPLVVFLHGSRDTVSHDMLLYQDSVRQKHPAFVLTPKCEESYLGWGSTWKTGHTEATEKTLALVDSLVKQYRIDTGRLYIYGISMGGFGVFSVLAKEKGKFAAGYAVCGGSSINAAGQLLQTPLWIFHGEIDDIVPIALSKNVYQEMIRLGGKKVHYTEYPGVKHNSWENVAKEKWLVDWLFAQKKEQEK